jgi:hypothetical protein
MQLATATEKALDAWIMTGTWHTGHALDMGRFFAFVDQYQKDHGYAVDEQALAQLTEGKAGCQGNGSLALIIRERVNLASSILDFLKATGR